MSVEKISSSELNAYKWKLEVEQKAPEARRKIEEMAAPFMAEALSLQQQERMYVVDEEAGELILLEEQPVHNNDRMKRNIEIVNKNLAKIENLPGAVEYVEKAMKMGKTQKQATTEYLLKLSKFVSDGSNIMEMSESELQEISKEDE